MGKKVKAEMGQNLGQNPKLNYEPFGTFFRANPQTFPTLILIYKQKYSKFVFGPTYIYESTDIENCADKHQMTFYESIFLRQFSFLNEDFRSPDHKIFFLVLFQEGNFLTLYGRIMAYYNFWVWQVVPTPSRVLWHTQNGP